MGAEYLDDLVEPQPHECLKGAVSEESESKLLIVLQLVAIEETQGLLRYILSVLWNTTK